MSNGAGHVTKMVTMPISGTNPSEVPFLLNPKAIDFETWFVSLGMPFQICSNDDPSLNWTYFMTVSNLIAYVLSHNAY